MHLFSFHAPLIMIKKNGGITALIGLNLTLFSGQILEHKQQTFKDDWQTS